MQGVTVFNKQENWGFQPRILLDVFFFVENLTAKRMHVHNNPIKQPTLNKVTKNMEKCIAKKIFLNEA